MLQKYQNHYPVSPNNSFSKEELIKISIIILKIHLLNIYVNIVNHIFVPYWRKCLRCIRVCEQQTAS